MNQKYLTMKEAAALARVSYSTIYNWKRAGRIKGTQPEGTGKVLIDAEKFDNFLKYGRFTATIK